MWYAVAAILVLILDQVTKAVVASLSGATPGSLGNDKILITKVIDGFLEIEYCENNNGMMGIFSFLNNGRLVFIIATVIILGGIVAYLFLSKNRGKWLNTALALIISGALGNFIDRIFTDGGYVRDMIHVIIEINGKEYFPYIFNVADISLVVGAIMLVIDILFISKDAIFVSKKRREELERKQAENAEKIDEAKKLVADSLKEEDLIESGSCDNTHGNACDNASDNARNDASDNSASEGPAGKANPENGN